LVACVLIFYLKRGMALTLAACCVLGMLLFFLGSSGASKAS
jgi:hypothetical protein